MEARGGGGYALPLPFDAREAFGKVRAPVRVTIREHSFRTTTMRYGTVDYIGLNRQVRDAAGIGDGESLTVEMELDSEPRDVDVPVALSRALEQNHAAKAAFAGLSYTHKKEYARWISEAKREETRKRRVAKAVVMLRDGVRTPG